MQVAAQVGTLGANSLDAVFPPDEYWRHLAWMLLVTLGGGMLAAAWHKPLMADRHTTFPTGDAAGSLIAALHVPPGSYHGRNQRKKFSFWAVMSGCVAAYTWVFSHPACLGLQQVSRVEGEMRWPGRGGQWPGRGGVGAHAGGEALCGTSSVEAEDIET